MSVREFHDGRGREWRAWEVRPDELDVRTKDEDYLASIYYTGWIVFEDTSGGEKRRLHPIPKGWADLPIVISRAFSTRRSSFRSVD